MKPPTPHTLADFSIPIPLYCLHCGLKLGKKTPAEVHGKSVYVLCKCGCPTPFKLEKSA